jgi:hypothetical protein
MVALRQSAQKWKRSHDVKSAQSSILLSASLSILVSIPRRTPADENAIDLYGIIFSPFKSLLRRSALFDIRALTQVGRAVIIGVLGLTISDSAAIFLAPLRRKTCKTTKIQKKLLLDVSPEWV